MNKGGELVASILTGLNGSNYFNSEKVSKLLFDRSFGDF